MMFRPNASRGLRRASRVRIALASLSEIGTTEPTRSLLHSSTGGVAAAIDEDMRFSTDPGSASQLSALLPDDHGGGEGSAISNDATASTKCSTTAPYARTGEHWGSHRYTWWYNGDGNPGTGSATRIPTAGEYLMNGRT